jgi:hypothetical protein
MKKYTYIAHDGRYYKIGESEHPEQRMKELRTGNPSVKLLFYGDAETEKYLHNLFYHKRVAGEWFRLKKRELALCKMLVTNPNIEFKYRLQIDTIRAYSESLKAMHQYKIPFGKYKGLDLKTVYEKDMKYLIWVYGNLDHRQYNSLMPHIKLLFKDRNKYKLLVNAYKKGKKNIINVK